VCVVSWSIIQACPDTQTMVLAEWRSDPNVQPPLPDGVDGDAPKPPYQGLGTPVVQQIFPVPFELWTKL